MSTIRPRWWGLDKNNEPYPLPYGTLPQGEITKRGEKTILDNGEIEISTVFLGLDHSFGNDGPPVLFETMIFAEKYPDIDQYQTRSTSWVDAQIDHITAIAVAKAEMEKSKEEKKLAEEENLKFIDIVEYNPKARKIK